MGISSSKLILGNVNKAATMKHHTEPVKNLAAINTEPVPKPQSSVSKPASGGADFMKQEVNLASVNTDPILKGNDLASVNTDPILKPGGLDSGSIELLKGAESFDKQSLAPDSMTTLRNSINADDFQSLQSISQDKPALTLQASAEGKIEPLVYR